MKGKILVSVAAATLLLAGSARAMTPEACDALIRSAGGNPEALQTGDLKINGYLVQVHEGDFAQKICERYVLASSAAQAAQISRLTFERDLARAKTADLERQAKENGFLKRNYLYAWAGLLGLSTFVMGWVLSALMGRRHPNGRQSFH